jgi:replicative DNA helicase
VSDTLVPGRTDDVQYAERSVLGTIITHRTVAEYVFEILDTDDCFADAIHQAVAAAVRYLTDTGEPLGEAAVLARLVATETGVWRTGQAGGIITDLVRYASPAWTSLTQVVHRAALQRRTLDALTSSQQIAAEPGFDVATGGEQILERVAAALTTTRPDSRVSTMAELYIEAIDRLDSPTPPGKITVPWEELRKLVPFLRPGQLIAALARPSLGKSVLGQDLARHVALRLGLPVVLHTMEMDRAQVMDRMLAAEAGVPFGRLTAKKLRDEDWKKIAAAQDRFLNAGDLLLIDDTPGVTLAHARARLRGMDRSGRPAALAIFDYLQLMDPPKGENREQQVGALVKGLKAIAREWDIPVLLLAQLNRGVELRADRRPYVSDARESGAIENDTDVALLIHRPEHYDSGNRPGEADLIVDKNRDGQRGTATVAFQGQFMRFADWEWKPATPPPPPPSRTLAQADVVAQAEIAAEERRDELAARRLANSGRKKPSQKR